MPSWELPTPCICTRNSFFILLVESLSPSERFEHKESISSMKMIDGFFSRAISKRFLTSLIGNVKRLLAHTRYATARLVRNVLFTFALPLRHET